MKLTLQVNAKTGAAELFDSIALDEVMDKARQTASASAGTKPIMPAQPASSVLLRTTWVRKFAPKAQPPLKPNHPKNRMPPPSITSGTLCGRSGRPLRGPSARARASAATPEFMWTAVPPA